MNATEAQISAPASDYLSPYPAYKESDVPWLGQLPERWTVQRLRTLVELRVSNVDKNQVEGEIPIRLCNYVDVYKHPRIVSDLKFMRATATQQEIEHFRLQCGDVIITKDSEAWNDIGVPSLVEYTHADLVCGYHLAILRSRSSILGSYLFWVIQSQGVSSQLHVAANGVTRFGLSQGAIKSLLLPVPTPEEQLVVACFLDHMDRRIRRLIRSKLKLIKLLEEEKQATIYLAVTRGIDPNVRLKRSGVEWLGDVPEHWEVRRNGRLFAQRNQTGFAQLPILEVSLRTGVRVRQFDNSSRKQVMSDWSKYKRAAKGDIAYNMMRMWQGAVGVPPEDGLVSPAYVVAAPFDGVDVRYFANLFRTAAYMGEVDAHSRGIVKDRNRLYWEDFKQIFSPYPPPEEQAAIADSIGSHSGSIDNLIVLEKREIELLNEYRTRLIADVVTGKLDVRQAAEHLPDESEDPEELESAAEALEDGEEAELASEEVTDEDEL
jgi:type I restriction enzyme S subunit